MRMQKIQFRIGQLAKELCVEKFVIRFWEKEFRLPTYRSNGGQRFYSQDDLEQFKMIKTLLYDQGFTIAGAKKRLSDNEDTATIVGSCKTTLPALDKQSDDLTQKIVVLRQQLIVLSKLL